MNTPDSIYRLILLANIAIYDNKIFKHRYDDTEAHVDISSLSHKNTKVVYWNENTHILILESKTVDKIIDREQNRKKFIQIWANQMINGMGLVDDTPVRRAGVECIVSNIMDDAIKNMDQLEFPW